MELFDVNKFNKTVQLLQVQLVRPLLFLELQKVQRLLIFMCSGTWAASVNRFLAGISGFQEEISSSLRIHCLPFLGIYLWSARIFQIFKLCYTVIWAYLINRIILYIDCNHWQFKKKGSNSTCSIFVPFTYFSDDSWFMIVWQKLNSSVVLPF